MIFKQIEFLTIRSAAYRVGTMNIDERLEALTHSVELLAAMHKDGEKRHMTRTGFGASKNWSPASLKARRGCFMSWNFTNNGWITWKGTAQQFS